MPASAGTTAPRPTHLRVREAGDEGTGTRRNVSLRGSAPHVPASAGRCDGPAGDGPLPRQDAAEAGEARHRRTDDASPRADVIGRPGRSPDRNGHAVVRSSDTTRRTSEKARQDHHATMTKKSHWMWYLALALGSTLPREQVPVGSAVSNASGETRRARCQPRRWLGQERTDLHPELARQRRKGLGPQTPANPWHHGRADGSRPRSDATEEALRRLGRWNADGPFIMETGLQWAKPKGASGGHQVARLGGRNGFVSGRKP